MKLNNLLKLTPFLSTILLIFILSSFNQKINTKLKILIWNTPSLSLGNYLAIATGTGFAFSYILTTNFASIIKHKSVDQIQYKNEINYEIKNEDTNEDTFINHHESNEKTLIERNIKDPLPTMNAQFRVIGKTERYNNKYINDKDIQYENSFSFEKSLIDQNENNESINQGKEDSSDWNDDSFTSW